jgi:hypothetical protein
MRRIAAWLPILTLSACLSFGNLDDVSEPPKDKPLVFGSVRVFEGETEKKWPRNYLAGTHFWLLVLAKDAGRAKSYRLGAAREFYWALAPGEYHLLGFIMRSFKRETSGRLWASFTVPAGAGAVYIGDLAIRLANGGVSTKIGDNFDQNSSTLAKKFPRLSAPPEKAVMKMVADQGTFTEVVDGCDESWGIQCTENYQGVGPKYPVTGGSPFGIVSSLTPVLGWQPSTKAGVGYDLVVFEEVHFTYGLGAFAAKLPGSAVIYRQNLTAPQFELAEPLRPETNHYWSVRLRRGETVTAWSRYRKTGFYLPAWVENKGPWFVFATPKKQSGK